MSEPSTMDAVRAMRDCGIDGPEHLLEHAEPSAILRTCDWFESKRTAGEKIGAGLLVSKIRKGGISEEQASSDGLTDKQRKRARLLDVFAEKCERFPVGAVAGTCKCGGELVVIAAGSVTQGDGVNYHPGASVNLRGDTVPIEACCDACTDVWTFLPRNAHTLPPAPLSLGRDEPAAGEACPADGSFAHPRREDRGKGLHRLEPVKALPAERQSEKVAVAA